MRYIEENMQRPYPIVIMEGFADITKWIYQKPSSICIITDDQVASFYLEEVRALLETIAPTCSHIIVPGEASKNLSNVSQVYHTLTKNHMDRSSLIVALGGGVVGDLAGFVAATYMRGIPFVQIPTTIVAQNDSSVGGKVGVDYLDYKNMVGAFYNPTLVYINIETLFTLPVREIYAGMSEVIKHGVIKDPSLVQYLETYALYILNKSKEKLIEMTYQSICIKADIVAEDPKEKGTRKILNFGHTIGHALESLSGFKYLHGECVGYGMVMATYISYKRLMVKEEDLRSIITICRSYGLLEPISDINPEKVYECMLHDKKKHHGKIQFILLSSIGEAVICDDIEKQEIVEALGFIEKTCH